MSTPKDLKGRIGYLRGEIKTVLDEAGADFDMIPPQSAAIGMAARSTGGGDAILASAVRSEPRTDRFFIRASASGGHGAGLDSFMNGDIIQLNPLATREGFENDAVLTVQADARPGGSGQGFSTVYADVVGTVTNRRGETLFTQTLTQIKGIQLNVPQATDAAYNKAAEEMSKEFIPDLIRLWHGL